MRVCNCPGILAKVQAAFADRLLGWAKLGARRPEVVSVNEVCGHCGKVWDLELRHNPKATEARRLALGAP